MERNTIFVQCTTCGKIYEVDEKYKPEENDIYIDLYCSHCKEVRRYLYCFENRDDLYIYADNTLDKRYY